MSTKAVINCKSCNKKFELYWSQLPSKPFSCPNCGAKMTDYMSKQVISALASVVDANVELNKLHLQDEEPLFEVSVKHEGSVKK